MEGLLLIVLGGLGGLADNPEAETAMTDGYVVLAFGATVLTAVSSHADGRSSSP
ncbi:MAG TPA: hypothetical protein VHI98_27390 [Vicinamibacterales bacterium]|nr:hypothetical protein [Vicinamibacterales bacterium]